MYYYFRETFLHMKKPIRSALALLFVAPLFVSFGFVAPKTTHAKKQIYEYAFAYQPTPIGNNYYSVAIWLLQVNIGPDYWSGYAAPFPISVTVNYMGTNMSFTFPQDSIIYHIGAIYSPIPLVNGFWMSTNPTSINGYRIYDTLTDINNDNVQ